MTVTTQFGLEVDTKGQNMQEHMNHFGKADRVSFYDCSMFEVLTLFVVVYLVIQHIKTSSKYWPTAYF